MKKLLLKQQTTKRLVLLVLLFILLMPSTAWGEEYTYDSFGDWSGNAGMYSCLTIDFQNSTTVYSPDKFSNISKVEIVAGGASQINSSFEVSVNGSDYRSIVSTTGNGYVIPSNVDYGTYTFTFTPDETPRSVVISAQYNAMSGTQGWVYIQSVTIYTEEEKDPEPYAVLSNNNTVLTFYYDGNKVSQNGYGIGPFELTDTRWGGNSSTITKVVFDSSFKNCTSITSTAYWFLGCYHLTTIEGIDNLKTSNVVDMTAMFADCQSLTSLTLWNFDTSNVTYMNSMFQDCSSLVSLNLEGFNTEKVTDMNCMFRGCKKLPSLMLTDFNTKNVTNMWCMFFDCNALTTLDIYYFDTSNVTDMSSMFQDCSSLSYIDLRGFNTEKVTNMGQMFDGCSKVTKLDMSKFNTQNVTNFQCLFMNCAELTTLDLTTFNTAQVKHMGQVFQGCSKLKTIYVDKDKWTTSAVTFGPKTFDGCTSLIGGASTAYNAEQIDYTYARIDGGTDNPGYFTRKDGPAMGSCDMSEIPADNAYYAATSFLCERGVLDGSKVDGKYLVEKELLRQHLANITFRGLFTLNGREIPSTFVSDQYPDIYDDLKSDAPYYQAAKTLLYLDYGDGITPFDRDRDGFLPDGNEARINVLKELMEAFNIKSDMEGTDNPFPNEANMAHLSETSPIKMGYVRQAAKLGIITTEKEQFRPYEDCLRGEAFLMLARIIQKIEAGEITDPNPQESDFLDPNSGMGTADPNAEAYAVLSDNNTVLTFYYDDQKTERNGMGVGPFTNSYDRGWSLMSNSITSVVFDASFANCTTLTSTAYWFYGLNISSITGIGNLKTDNVTYMRYMFAWCRSLTNLDLSGFKTDNVTSMYGMFCECSGLTSLNLSVFKTDNVTDMSKMFSGCTSLTSLDVSGFKTDNVTDMTDMFHACLGLTSLDVTGFKTDNVTDMDGMFSDCSGLTSLNLSGFKTNNVTNMSKMFSRCSGLTSLNLSGFKTDNVTSMYCMFSDCSSLTSLDLSGFKTENVTDMGIMFSDCSSLTSLDVRGFKTENVTNMNAMFYGCSGLTSLDVSGFNTSKVTNMSWMFTSCSSLKTIYTDDGWNTAQVQDGEGMFSGCYRLVGGAGTQYDVSHTDHTYARIDGGASNPGYFTAASSEPWQNSDEFEPYAVLTDNDDEITTDEGTNKGKTLTFYYDNQKEDRGGMSVVFSSTADRGWGIEGEKITKAVFDGSFANCTTLTSTKWWFLFCKNLKTIIGITNLKTDNVADMTGMFYGCSSLTSLDLSSLNTSSLKTMFGIFQDCYGLKSINLTNFKTDNVEEMGQLFLNCSSLESLDVSGFNTDGVSSMFNMFSGCSSLNSLDLSNFNTKKVKNMAQMFRGCSNLTTIFVGSNWSTEVITQSTRMFQDCTSLVGGAGTAFDANHIEKAYAHIDGGTANPGYFTDKNATPIEDGSEPYAVLSDNYTVLTFYYDSKKESRGGLSVGPFADEKDRAWNNYRLSISSVVFDKSFANCTTLTSTAYWFYECSNLTDITGISNLKTDHVTDMMFMFHGCESLTSIDVSGFKTDNLENMQGMFFRCEQLTSMDLSGFNTEKVTNMSALFSRCEGMTSVDLSGFKTDLVTSMRLMFNQCSSLTSLNLTDFNTEKVSDMGYMFADCSSLSTIYVSNTGWNLSQLLDGTGMFENCTSLAGGAGTTFDTSYIDETYAHIDGGTANPGYFTAKAGGSGEKSEGDLNGDGNVDNADMEVLVSVVMGGDKDKLAGADLNHDGKVDAADIVTLVNMIRSQK